ncbi:MAG: hypothetical protein LUC50_03010 [Ruminococcus sp.]|nr:hypothetical protein [Ruminococcus sp.]
MAAPERKMQIKPSSKKFSFARRMLYVLLPFVLPLCLIAMGILLLVNETLITNVFLGLGLWLR